MRRAIGMLAMAMAITAACASTACTGEIGGAPTRARGTPDSPTERTPLGARIWALTPLQQARTIATIVPGWIAPDVEGPVRADRAAARLTLSQPETEAMLARAESAATHAVGAGLVPACMVESGDAACVGAYLDALLPQAFRRPVDADDRARFEAFHAAERAIDDAPTAAQQLLVAVMMSPDFVFRTELGSGGPGVTHLAPHEIAAAISYLATDGPPDAALRAAAEDGALDDGAVRAEHARRLLASTDDGGAIAFVRELFGYRAVEAVSRTDGAWSPELARALADESDAFVRGVVRDDGRLATLLSSRETFLDERLVAHYGVEAAAGPVTMPAALRAGLLTHGSMMAVLAKDGETRPVARAAFVLETLLCRSMTPPPTVPPLPPPDGMLQTRERIEAHTASTACQGCHAQLNPLGFPFESFDELGRPRSEQLGRPIDPTGAIVLGTDVDGEVDDAHELATRLAMSLDVERCVALQAARFASGTGAPPAHLVEDARAAMRATDGDLREAFVAVVASPAFAERAGGE